MLDLLPHGGHGSIDDVHVSANAWRRGTTLTLTFSLTGALGRVWVPAPTAPRMTEGLWRRTCFEAFVGRDGSEAYHELNLSPSSEWAVLAFGSYRTGGALHDPAVAPETRIRREVGAITLEAVVSLAQLDAAYVGGPVRVGLTAVVEDRRGACTYWALAHAPGAPDFHRAVGWTLCLEAPRGACDGDSS